MATTYGYGGEFSSDEDVDKLEQQRAERLVQAKFDNSLRPSKKQIEDTIEAIRRMPLDQDVLLSDDMLAGLLDYFKTQRGPIVDSTRKLYNRIALRLVRGEQQLTGADNAQASKETNGNSDNVNDNNNSIKLNHKAPQQKADNFSSDEDDEIQVFTVKRSDVHNGNDDNKMEVDSETPTGPVRQTKQVDMSTTDEEDEESGEASDVSSELEELNSESDVMDVTPIKAPAVQQTAIDKEKEGVEALIAASRMTPRQPESSIKRQQPLAQSTPKDLTDTAKKPYTRSQRVATRSATRGKTTAGTSSAKNATEVTSADVFIETKRSPKKKYVLISISLLVVILAFVLYYFRSSIESSASPYLSPKVKF